MHNQFCIERVLFFSAFFMLSKHVAFYSLFISQFSIRTVLNINYLDLLPICTRRECIYSHRYSRIRVLCRSIYFLYPAIDLVKILVPLAVSLDILCVKKRTQFDYRTVDRMLM